MVQNSKQCVKLYTYGQHRQWATATSTKPNYFRFTTIALNFMRAELSNIVDLQTV